MKSKRVLRYYCDFCKKSGCGKYAMEQHELYCTMNPNRKCKMCAIADMEQLPIDALKRLLPLPKVMEDDYGVGYTVEENPLKKLHEATDCPACILATIRQSGQMSYMYEFDFKKECKLFWDDVNKSRLYFSQ